MLLFAFYLMKVSICSAVLFGYYWFFLRNKIFHRYNRFFLLAIVVLSLVLPMIKINVWHKADQPQPDVIKMLQVVNNSDEYMDEVIVYSRYNNISKEQVISILYFFVCAVFFFLLVQVLIRIWIILKKNPATIVENIYFVKTAAKGTPFSFLKFIFWNDAIDIETKAGKQVFKHEVAHVQEKHSYDKLFLNIVLIFCWCNPFFWLIRKELNMIHEFIADKKAVEDGDTADFAAMILQATYPQHRFPIANNFFYSPIKRRLLMLTKQNKTKVNYISRLLVLPLAVIVFAAFTFKTKTYTDSIANVPAKPLVVMIDAGHGGTDNGATANGNIYEKDISLLLAKSIRELNQSPNIQIILTRETDIYQSPQQKAALAKPAGADLFISIHIDGAPESAKNMRTGMSVYVASDNYENSAASKLLASAVIKTFRKNYGLEVAPNPQQRQHVQVLQSNTCPSILIEAGCINNPKDLLYLKTDKAVEIFAADLLKAIESYSITKTTQPFMDEASVALSVTEKKPDPENVKNEPLLKTPPPIEKPIPGVIDHDLYLEGFEKTGSSNIPPWVWNENDFTAEYRPFFIVNGKEAESIKELKISNEDISDIRLLTPATAMPTYGEKAKRGVIIINTKKSVVPSNALIVLDGKIYKNQHWDEVMAANDFRAINKMELLEKDKAIEKFGIIGNNGAIVISTRPGSTENITYSLSGIRGPRINISQLKNLREVQLSSAEYVFKYATVYFSGAGFQDVVVTQLTGASLEKLAQYFSRIVGGTNVTFDNVKIEKAGTNSIMEINGKSFSFYDNETSYLNSSDNKVFNR